MVSLFPKEKRDKISKYPSKGAIKKITQIIKSQITQIQAFNSCNRF